MIYIFFSIHRNQSPGHHLVVILPSSGCHLNVISLSFGGYLDDVWTFFDLKPVENFEELFHNENATRMNLRYWNL